MGVRWLVAGGGVWLIVVLIGGLFLTKTGDSHGGQSIGWAATPTPTPKTEFSWLVLGKGGGGHDGGHLTDTIQLVRVNTAKKAVITIGIPRDLWVEFRLAGGERWEKKKLNHVLWLGGEGELKRVVGDITGVIPENFVVIDFAGFVKLVDLVGGIEVEVPASFVDELYPIKGRENDTCGRSEEEMERLVATLSGVLVDKQLTCRYERVEFVRGVRKMDGETALKFVRSRHSTSQGGDFARQQRQQAVIKAMVDKLVSLQMLSKVNELRSGVWSTVRTDLDMEDLWRWVPMLPEFKSYKLLGLVLSTENVLKEGVSWDGQYILLPKREGVGWEEVREWVTSEAAKVWQDSWE